MCGLAECLKRVKIVLLFQVNSSSLISRRAKIMILDFVMLHYHDLLLSRNKLLGRTKTNLLHYLDPPFLRRTHLINVQPCLRHAMQKHWKRTETQ